MRDGVDKVIGAPAALSGTSPRHPPYLSYRNGLAKPSTRDFGEDIMFKKIAASAVITFAILAAGQQVQAASDNSGTLVVRGTVETNCTVSIQDMGVQLDLTKGVNNVVVGKVTETCNDPDGYSISFTSQGGGNLKSGNAAVAYTASYDNVNHQDLGSEMRLTRKDAAFGEVNDLKVTVKGGSDRVAGAYSDIITVTIAAN